MDRIRGDHNQRSHDRACHHGKDADDDLCPGGDDHSRSHWRLYHGKPLITYTLTLSEPAFESCRAVRLSADD
jgi:hypothetical protein